MRIYHGFDPGKIDGIVGERTRAAIAAVATKHRLPATRDHNRVGVTWSAAGGRIFSNAERKS
jgi:peptidoglycan hydrolase-like protein with peptidoglycan-binding domain